MYPIDAAGGSGQGSIAYGEPGFARRAGDARRHLAPARAEAGARWVQRPMPRGGNRSRSNMSALASRIAPGRPGTHRHTCQAHPRAGGGEAAGRVSVNRLYCQSGTFPDPYCHQFEVPVRQSTCATHYRLGLRNNNLLM